MEDVVEESGSLVDGVDGGVAAGGASGVAAGVEGSEAPGVAAGGTVDGAGNISEDGTGSGASGVATGVTAGVAVGGSESLSADGTVDGAGSVSEDSAGDSALSVAGDVAGDSALGVSGSVAAGGSGRRNTILGYIAGIVTGVTYGLNPLFAKPLLEMGVSIDTMLSFRYLLAVLILGVWLVARKESLRVNAAQTVRLVILGILFALSSATLFFSYNYIPAGLATTIVFLYPVLVALIMVFLKVYPTWQVWLSIILTFAGVIILSLPSSGVSFNAVGLLLAGASALVYAMYLIIVNRSRRLRTVSNHVLTFYALLFGSLLFLGHGLSSGGDLLAGVHGWLCWLCLFGLAIFPTLMSLLCLAASTRLIGATKTSVLGVAEPVTAIAVGCIFFNESLTLNVIVGVTITLFAVTFMALTDRKR